MKLRRGRGNVASCRTCLLSEAVELDPRGNLRIGPLLFRFCPIYTTNMGRKTSETRALSVTKGMNTWLSWYLAGLVMRAKGNSGTF